MRNFQNYFVIGDFNIDLIKSDVISQEFLNNFLELGFLPSFENVTRHSLIDNLNETCIDNIFYKFDKVDVMSCQKIR